MNIDRAVLSAKDQKKLEELDNGHMTAILEKYVNLLKPSKVTVITDGQDDIDYARQTALSKKEERKLAMEGHTVHYDGYYDQARDKANTRVLVTPGMKMSSIINTIDRDQGLEEVHGIMEGLMAGKEAFVRLFCLGPLDSRFSISALQLTDSGYVAHSEDILYRSGYQQFKKLGGSPNFFTFIHSAGELDGRGNSSDIKNRRIYVDLMENRVLTVNNQYAGNSLGLKKLALRLAIYRANQEDWLTEHMFVMGAKPPGKDRTTYFSGAFPSACGKTSTAMIPGQSIVGDDIAYLRRGGDGRAYAVNIEQGIFGIIMDVNPTDDPVIYNTLTTSRELIFSNILVNSGRSYWLGMGKDLPEEGINHFGDWRAGNKDAEGKPIGPCHKNARYTVRIEDLENADPRMNDPDGVAVQGVIYGGRDSDTSVPVYQSLNWVHGVALGATLESETTSATLGAEGVRKFNPMANLDFLVVPLGRYIRNHIRFGESLSSVPLVFSTNYFLKEEGRYLNEKVDKKIWLLWMEGRIHNEYDALETPIGLIPMYEDLKDLFQRIFDRNYTREEYDLQFAIRIDRFIEKLDRMDSIYADEDELPEAFTQCLVDLRTKLEEVKKKSDKEILTPAFFGG
jgi:phosphoenolpyruvate carboxykinase (GTP)